MPVRGYPAGGVDFQLAQKFHVEHDVGECQAEFRAMGAGCAASAEAPSQGFGYFYSGEPVKNFSRVFPSIFLG